MNSVPEIINTIESKGIDVVVVESTTQYAARIEIKNRWKELKEGDCLVITKTNPKSYEEYVNADVCNAIHQIDGPPKFTVDNVTVIRKTGELILSDGLIEWEGFDMFREAILHLVTMDEAIKIIDSWK